MSEETNPHGVIKVPRKTCIFVGCDNSLGQWGNNALPIKEGRCCDDCNMNVVLPARIALMNIRRGA
jgi:hypothetical protein